MSGSTEPTPHPTDPPAAGQGLVEFVRGNRPGAGRVLLGLTAVLVAAAAFLFYKGYYATETRAADKPLGEKADPLRPETRPPAETEAQSARRTQFNLGWVACVAAAAVAGAASGWLLVRPAPDTEGDQRSEARVLLLAVGGVLGAVLIVTGLAFFYLWSDSLTAWLDRGEGREARWVLIPLVAVVAGAGLVFLAIQPARAEERNSQLVRKLVYGANFALTVLLLVVGLVVANVAFALKVPNKLDATATGFYSLSDATKSLLGRLSEPLNVVAVLPDLGAGDRQAQNVQQLLLACEDASGGRFRVRFLSDSADRTELATLQRKYPPLERALNERFGMEGEVGGAVLLVVGDGPRHAVIPAREFSSTEGRQTVFNGEARLFKEVAFLADAEGRPTVYFTQGSGDLSLDPGPGVSPARAAGRLKKYLEDSYVTVRPLDLTGEAPAVPADAAVVVVADPVNLVPAAGVAALRKYVSDRKGKLVVLAGAHPGGDRKMIPTGLDPLLADLNVRLGTRFVYTDPRESRDPYTAVAGFAAMAEENPIFQTIFRVTPRLFLRRPREVEPLTANPGLQATPLLLTTGLTWVEDPDPADLAAAMEALAQNRRVQEAREFGRTPRPVAAVVSEGAAGRAVVIGGSYFVTDEAARRAPGSPVGFDLIGTSVDWLRDRPSATAAGIESKKYSLYRFPQPSAVDETRLKYLPLGLAFLAVVGLGTGVWVVRRK